MLRDWWMPTTQEMLRKAERKMRGGEYETEGGLFAQINKKELKKPNLTYTNLSYPNLTFGGLILANCPWANSPVTV